MQAAYVVDPQGSVRAEVPERCPMGEDGSACVVARHHRRERKSGPEHPVAVCRCRAHGVSFTVYPPGHVPYGRVAIVAQDSEGRALQGDALGSTVFGAALDASDGAGRASEQAGRGERVHRRTQGRRLRLCAALLGILAGVTEEVRGRIAEALWVPRLALREAAQAYASSGSIGKRALVVLAVLERVGVGRRRVGLLIAGHFAGLWGGPSLWDSGGRMLRALV